jgi:hypothetical protein
MRRRLALIVCAGTFLVGWVAVRAAEQIDQDAYWRIRREGIERSRILETAHVLTDVYGARLTGSPALKAAGEWAAEQMKAWGLQNAHLEPWDFGHSGWTNERLAAHIVSPVKDALVAEALAWTPSTKGMVRGAAVRVTLPSPLTADQLASELDKLKPLVRGKVVLVGVPRTVSVTFNPPPLRREDADLRTQLGAPPPPATPPRGGGPGPAAAQQNAAAQESRPLTANQVDERLNAFLAANDVLARFNDAGRDHGQIRAFNNRTYDPAKAPPILVVRNEDYGRIWRLLAGGRTVELELDVVNRIHPEGTTVHNVVAEIPGSDKADEVVMLGGHLDSWHAGTGATDNAIGCAVMMEAARIIVAAGLKPRRTIRVALWGGEEQGLFGSQAYVREHFGMVESPKADHGKLAAYFNLDSGTGRARGMTVFGPPAAATVLQEAVAPFADLGVLGANTTRSRNRGGSDHTSFNEAGLPGITILQDPIQYQTYTWHTNLDTYERIVEDDVKKAAVVTAAVVYHLAMRDGLLPRFSPAEMPRRPGGAPSTQ